jgi:intracellular septation protein
VKLLLDLLPVIVFFGAIRVAKGWPEATIALVTTWLGAIEGTTADQLDLASLILASLCGILFSVGQIGFLLSRKLPVAPPVWISAGLIVVFGGLTVWLHNAWFIKWKPSILYWIFALILLAGRWIWKRNLLGALLSQELELPPLVWDRLMYAWAAFFLFLGTANIAVAYAWSTDVWVNFKTFGLVGLTLVFSAFTGLYIARYLGPAPSDEAVMSPQTAKPSSDV